MWQLPVGSEASQRSGTHTHRGTNSTLLARPVVLVPPISVQSRAYAGQSTHLYVVLSVCRGCLRRRWARCQRWWGEKEKEGRRRSQRSADNRGPSAADFQFPRRRSSLRRSPRGIPRCTATSSLILSPHCPASTWACARSSQAPRLFLSSSTDTLWRDGGGASPAGSFSRIWVILSDYG